ncbi:MAG: DedA family protein [Acidobacteriota bacterium]
MLDDLLASAIAMPPIAWPLLMFFFGWVEHVFPPFPGDTLMLLGFFACGQGASSPAELVIAAVLGSILGAACAFRIGERWGDTLLERLDRRPRTRRWRHRLETLLARHGEMTLAVNRFVPGARNVMLFGAGALRLRFAPTVAWSALSSLAFVVLMAAAGLATAGSWDDILGVYRHMSGVAAVFAVAALALWATLAARRLGNRDAADREPV